MMNFQKDFDFLSDEFLSEYTDREVNWGFASGPNSLGEITFRRTYSREGEKWWQTVRRVVEGTYEVLYSHCRQHNIPFDIATSKKDAQNMYDLIFNFKFLPPGRGLWVQGTDHVKKVGGMALNNPLHEDTKILTKEYGWVSIKEVEGEQVHVLTSVKDYGTHAELVKTGVGCSSATWAEANISEAQIQPCRRITFKDKDGLQVSIIASKNHRWLRRTNTKADWERIEGDELQVGDWVPIVKPQDYFTLSKIGQQHGFFFGDGTRSNGELHQFSDSIVVLKDLFGDIQWINDEHAVVRHLPLAWGSLPEGSYALDKKYIYGFLSGYFAADGYVNASGAVELSSARLDEIQKVAELFKFIGIRCSDPQISIAEGTSNNLVESRNALYKIRLTAIDLRSDFFLKEKHRERWEENVGTRRRDWMRVTSIEENVGDHRVLCAEVPGYEQFVIDGFILTSNCAFVSTQNIDSEFDKPFRFLMDVSMLGVGCGFDTKGAGKIVWDPSHQNIITHQIADSREGWVDSVGALIRWGFGMAPKPNFDYSLIRPRGSLIRGFGGVSEGPEPLINLHNQIEKVILGNAGNAINSRDITDIMNMIGVCVVAGNVRRSAEISLGEPDDDLFLNLKNYEMFPERIEYGWASNNSVLVKVGDDYSRYAERIAANGEPGLVWLDNIRGFSRMTDKRDDKDWRAMGTNPCAEQSLESYEVCNLVETFPMHHRTLAEYKNTLKYAFIYAKAVSLLPTHWTETNAVMLRNRRIGTSMSGVAQFLSYRGEKNLIKWSKAGYSTILHYDRVYSEWLCVRESIKRTSVKPSGTVSLLAGATPGCHYPTHRHYIRRIRFAEHHPDVARFIEAGYHVEPAKHEPGTMIVEFPVAGDDRVPTETEVPLEDKVDVAVLLQEYWADNQVSCTATFNPQTEGSKIAEVIKDNETMLKSISFLPITEAGAYDQMPYEAITKERYEALVANLKKIEWTESAIHDMNDSFCDGLACEIQINPEKTVAN